MRVLAAISVLFAAVLLAQEKSADQEKIGQDLIHRKNGSVLRGTIVEETQDYIKVATKHGVIRIPRSDIKDIQRAPTVQEEYRRRLEATPETDAQKQYELAQWCRKFGLEGKARYHLFKALLADPDHEPTRIALGYVRYGGRWLPKKEVEKLIAGTNLVIHQGRVMTLEEYEALIKKKEEQQKQEASQPGGEEKPPQVEEKPKQEEKGIPWDKARPRKIGEYTLKTNLPRRRAAFYRNVVTSVQSNLKALLGSIIKEKGAEKTRIWVFASGEEFSMMTGVRREDGGFWRREEHLIATYHDAPEEKGGTTGILARMMAYDWMSRATPRGAVVPAWFVEGVAGYFEAAKFDKSGRCKLGGLPRQAVITVKSLLEKGRLPRITDLITAPRARFNDTMKLAAWSLVHFLHRTPKHRRSFSQYWQAVKVAAAGQSRPNRRFPSPFKRRQSAEKLFRKFFGETGKLETAWRAWIAKLKIPEEGKIRGNTYTSERYGFSFTKPADFSFLKKSQTTGFQIGAFRNDAKIEVLVLSNTRGFDAAALQKQEKKRLSRIYKEVKEESAKCADLSGFILICDDTKRRRPLPAGQPVMFYLYAYFLKGGKIYIVACSCFSVNRQKNEPAFRKAIAEFKVGGE